jgi:hypothetical protein
LCGKEGRYCSASKNKSIWHNMKWNKTLDWWNSEEVTSWNDQNLKTVSWFPILECKLYSRQGYEWDGELTGPSGTASHGNLCKQSCR